MRGGRATEHIERRIKKVFQIQEVQEERKRRKNESKYGRIKRR